MSRRCPECGEASTRPHLLGCSYAPNVEEREEFIKEHAVSIVRQQEKQLSAQAKQITGLTTKLRELERLREENARVRRTNAEQASVLSGNVPPSLAFVLQVEAAKIVDPLMRELETLRLAVAAVAAGARLEESSTGIWLAWLQVDGTAGYVSGETPAEALAVAAKERGLTP